MLEIVVPGRDLWDEQRECFIPIKAQKLQLEHSLVSISKWESEWGKAFLGKQKKTRTEELDYIRCMTLTKNVDPYTYINLTDSNMDQINDYIGTQRTATKFLESKNMPGPNAEVITSELIYYWMITLNIPVKFERWHLSRLLALIKICSTKNSSKKMSKSELMRRNRSLNEMRKMQQHTKG